MLQNFSLVPELSVLLTPRNDNYRIQYHLFEEVWRNKNVLTEGNDNHHTIIFAKTADEKPWSDEENFLLIADWLNLANGRLYARKHYRCLVSALTNFLEKTKVWQIHLLRINLLLFRGMFAVR